MDVVDSEDVTFSLREFLGKGFFGESVDEGKHEGLELAETVDQHVLAGLIGDFVEKLHKDDVAFCGEVDADVFEGE